ncbi:MAG: hypothetical protein ACI9IP_000382 [Arcticibacterium sp.]|jgi:hypothetical protein
MDDILSRLNKIEQLIIEQNSSTKEALNFKEACEYLEVSSSTGYSSSKDTTYSGRKEASDSG